LRGRGSPPRRPDKSLFASSPCDRGDALRIDPFHSGYGSYQLTKRRHDKYPSGMFANGDGMCQAPFEKMPDGVGDAVRLMPRHRTKKSWEERPAAHDASGKLPQRRTLPETKERRPVWGKQDGVNFDFPTGQVGLARPRSLSPVADPRKGQGRIGRMIQPTYKRRDP